MEDIYAACYFAFVQKNEEKGFRARCKAWLKDMNWPADKLEQIRGVLDQQASKRKDKLSQTDQYYADELVIRRKAILFAGTSAIGLVMLFAVILFMMVGYRPPEGMHVGDTAGIIITIAVFAAPFVLANICSRVLAYYVAPRWAEIATSRWRDGVQREIDILNIAIDVLESHH